MSPTCGDPTAQLIAEIEVPCNPARRHRILGINPRERLAEDMPRNFAGLLGLESIRLDVEFILTLVRLRGSSVGCAQVVLELLVADRNDGERVVTGLQTLQNRRRQEALGRRHVCQQQETEPQR